MLHLLDHFDITPRFYSYFCLYQDAQRGKIRIPIKSLNLHPQVNLSFAAHPFVMFEINS